jgi:hypothetical protein
MNSIEFTRDNLYKLVWSQSLLSLSRKFGVSDYELRKSCVKAEIPLPKSGHWSRAKYGKQDQPAELPKWNGEQMITLRLLIAKFDTDSNPADDLDGDSFPGVNFSVPRRLSIDDELIRIAFERLTGNNKISDFHHKGIIKCGPGELDIRVSPQNVNRALRIMNTFIKAVRAKGYEIEVAGHATNVVVQDQRFKVCIRERLRRTTEKDRWHYHYTASGILSFKLDEFHSCEWNDDKINLDHVVPKVIKRIETRWKAEVLLREQGMKQQAEREEKARIKQEQEHQVFQHRQRIEKELDDFKRLIADAERWKRSQTLANYLAFMESYEVGKGAITDEFSKWLSWAKAKSNWYNPFIESDDELLCQIDRTSLEIT